MIDIPSIVYGGIDGIITTFSIAVGSYSAGFERRVAIVLGFANLFGDAISMASSAYLSEKTRGNTHPEQVAITTFLAFVLLGCLPLLPYLFSPSTFTATTIIALSILMTLVALAILGIVRSKVDGTKYSIIETIVIGIVAGLVSYSVVTIINNISR